MFSRVLTVFFFLYFRQIESYTSYFFYSPTLGARYIRTRRIKERDKLNFVQNILTKQTPRLFLFLFFLTKTVKNAHWKYD